MKGAQRAKVRVVDKDGNPIPLAPICYICGCEQTEEHAALPHNDYGVAWDKVPVKRSQRAYGGRRTAQGGEVVSFVVPLPPAALRGNSRAHWTERKRAADEYSARVHEAAWPECGSRVYPSPSTRSINYFRGWQIPWERAAVEYEWRYAGARPDLDNVARAVKVLQDTLCRCPNVGIAGSPQRPYTNRYFLGLIEDDGGIEPVTFKRKKVKTKAEEGVCVTIERVLRGEG